MLSSRQRAIQQHYQEQFEAAGTLRGRAKVVQEYVSRWPDLAFRKNSWFDALYWCGAARLTQRAALSSEPYLAA